MTFEVIVELKAEVLDAEGRAIRESLARLGHEQLNSVKVAKRFLIDLASDDLEQATEIAERYLANPVAETFTVKRLSS